MTAFVPAFTGIVFYGVYAGVAVVSFWAARSLLRAVASIDLMPNVIRWFMTSFRGALASLLFAAIVVYFTLPKVWSFKEVHDAVKPGDNFSSVVDRLGYPSWSSLHRKGETVNGYNTGLVIGSVTVTVSPDGVVTAVSFAD